MTGEPFAYDQREHEALVDAWRRARLLRLTAPDSWLSLVGRFALPEGTSQVGSADDLPIVLPVERAAANVGRFERVGALVRFTPAAGADWTLRGRDGTTPLAPDVAVEVRSDRDGAPDKLALDALTLEVTEQPAGLFVRVRDPESPTRRAFPGLEYFPVNPKWRVVARLEPHVPPRTIELGYESGSSETYDSPGDAVFEIDGITQRVTPVYLSDRSRLYLVFRDETARDTTYGAGRFLYAPLPEAGKVLLDFNQAFSPPCAFTPYAACPLAPVQNRLPLRVEAGEKHRHD